MAIEKKQVALYGVHFKGVFGRNRSVKFKANRTLVERTQGVTEADFVAWLAHDFALDIKPKAGKLDVVVYRDGEVTRYSGEDGIDGRDYSMQLYQPYDAQTLYRVAYDGGIGLVTFVSEAFRDEEAA